MAEDLATRISTQLQRGDFLDRARLRRVSVILLILYAVSLAALIATSKGALDYAGRPLGTDFSNVYAAGKLVAEGAPGAALDPAIHLARQQEIFGAEVPLYGWHYPPFFLFVAAALSILPYTAAWIAWQAATFPAYLCTVSRIMPGRDALIAAAAFPAAYINVTHGQNGFLSAALFGGAMIWLDRRPLVAGVLIGLLAYKPHFGPLIPIVLAVSGRWRVFASATLTIVALVIASSLAFGAEIWSAFIENARFTERAIIAGGGPGWAKMQSLYAALRAVSVEQTYAFAAQGALAVLVVAVLVPLWRSRAAHETKSAGLIVGSLLATPYALDYDLALLAPAIAFLALRGRRAGFISYEKSLLALAALAPLFSRQIAAATLVPLGFISMVGLFTAVVRRARVEASAPEDEAPTPMAPAVAT
jgi:hypothetical protein